MKIKQLDISEKTKSYTEKKDIITKHLCDSNVNNIYLDPIMKMLNVNFIKNWNNYITMFRKGWEWKIFNILEK